MGHKLSGQEKADYVQNMFGRIAKRYNLMNRLMTMGQDQKWRRFVVKQANVPSDGVVLDLATGTGDIAFEVRKKAPQSVVVGADFAMPMMYVGQYLKHGDEVLWCGADAMKLPFASQQFDAVLSGYLVRNVIDIHQTLIEQYRVLKPGGKIVILDSSPPPNNILKPFIMIHLKYVIPILGRIISGKNGADAYKYLPESTQAFKTPEELVDLLKQAGFNDIHYRKFMFGTIAVHWAEKQK